MADKIMVASGKGGVGKSTLCLGIAAGLAALGRQALVVEADVGFRGLDISLSAEDTALYDLGDLLAGRSELGETILNHPDTGVHLLCAPNDPMLTPDRPALARLMADLDTRYHYILVDCGAGFGSWQAAMAELCDLGLLVTRPDPVSVRAASQTSSQLHRRGLSRQRLVINRIPSRFIPSKSIRDLDDVIDLVGAQLLGAVPEGKLPPGVPVRGSQPCCEEFYRIAQRLEGLAAPLVLYT